MSQSSDNENFDDYREALNSMRSNDKDKEVEKPKFRKVKVRNTSDYNTRLKNLNKSLREKLKELNDRLERVLEKIYVKSLNPNKREEPDTDPSQLKEVVDQELEKVKAQYDKWRANQKKLSKLNVSDPDALIVIEDKLKSLREKKKEVQKEIVEFSTENMIFEKQKEKEAQKIDDMSEIDNLIYKIKAYKKKKGSLEVQIEKHTGVIDKLKQKVTEWQRKVQNEKKQVDAAEQKYATVDHSKNRDDGKC